MLDYTKPYSTRFEIVFSIDDVRNVGKCSLAVNDKQEGSVMLWNFGIYSRFQGIGLGKQFLSEVLEFVSENGFFYFGLFVDKNNEIAYNLYKKFGFKEVRDLSNEEKMFRGLDIIYMERRV